MQQLFGVCRCANKKILFLILANLACLSFLQAQESIGGPTCIVPGSQYSYTLSGAAPNFTYSVSGGLFSTGLTNGSSSSNSATVLITWSTGISSGVITMVSEYGTNTLNVAPAPALSPGAISSGQTQSILSGTDPATINCPVATGGSCSATYTYLWQYSTDGVNYSSTGVTAQNLTFSTGITQLTYYRRQVNASGTINYSNVATVSVYTPVVGGSITPATQTINYLAIVAPLSSTGVSGGINGYTYQWQSSPDNSTWSYAAGTSSTFTPTGLTSKTYFRVAVSSAGSTAYSSSAVVNVYPQLLPGIIEPTNITIVSGSSPGGLSGSSASGGGCSGSYTYQWHSSTNGTSFSTVSGATAAAYTPGPLTVNSWYTRQANCNGATAYSDTVQVVISSSTPDLNYIRARNIIKPGVMDSATAQSLTSPVDVAQTTQYFDGLGRAVQSVAMQQSPLQHDMVSFDVYDPIGRESIKYLPYTATTTDGNYKPTAQSDQYAFNTAQFPGEQSYFGQTAYEPSPLNRVAATYAPGLNWEDAGRGVTAAYQINTSGDSVQNWTIAFPPGSLPVLGTAYGAGMLYKNVTIDEAGHTVVEYKDQQGKVVLKKVQLWNTPATGPSGWLNTYYVYDDLDNLRFVIPPAAVQWLQANGWNFAASGGSAMAFELCFRYEYDFRKRMMTKKVPGDGQVWMVYDGRDRLVMTQDSNLQMQGKWLVNAYDIQNRPDSVGLLADNHSQSYHQNLALNSSYYPVIANYPQYTLETVTHYDNYSWVSAGGAALSSTMNTSNTTNSSYFITGYNTSPTYSQPITYFPITRGQVTGSIEYIIGSPTGQVMYNVTFYDDRNQVIQSENQNITNGVDLTTMQYDFSGKPLRTLLVHKKNSTPAATHTVVTKLSYDQAFRLKSIFKSIDGAAADQLIDSMQYNELGLLRAKYLGNKVDSLVYAYNIRGWLTGINPNYVGGTATNYFGMELGYDKSGSLAPGNTYATQEYNGNIEGTVWKSAGSGVNRKYDFSYDAVNRLTAANFNQYNGSTFDKSANIDFSVSNLSYDANGNILTMNQNGWLAGLSGAIDILQYNYLNSGISNRLQCVTDAANVATTQLGDFHYNPTTKTTTDYAYDGNGNLHSDNNKAIDTIKYNYLNLADTVHMKGKGYIFYTYDASGRKWKKIITDSLSRHSTTILYIEGFVYQQSDTITNAGGGADTLQFMAHEEGRARWAFQKLTTGTTGYSFQYDFFEKDHLGNIRMVLTQERDTTNYLASMEAAYRSTESQLFGNITSTCVAWTSMPNYQNILNTTRYATTSPNDSVSKVDYTGTSGQTTGPSLLLKVMSGDTVKIGVQCYYNTGSGSTNNSSFNSVLNSLASGLVSIAGTEHGTLTNLTASGSSVYGGVSSFLTTDESAPSGYPKAYLNYIFLDDQFNYVSSLSGAIQAASATYPAGSMNIVAPGSQIGLNKSGYLYIWVSNETQGWDVFFDNLAVQYKQGPVLEENHYYPFGLTMAGISDKAIKTQYAENKFRYNEGSELQNKEFADGSGLEWYDPGFRNYDPQLGRFWQIDPLGEAVEDQSLYAYAYNNPILLNDPLGLLSDSAHPQNREPATVTAVKKGCKSCSSSATEHRSPADGNRKMPNTPSVTHTSPNPVTTDGSDPDDGSTAGTFVTVIAAPVLEDPEPLTKTIGAAVLAAAITYEATQRTYVTYVTIHPLTGEVYVGRTSGFGDPESILSRRWANHTVLRAQGFPRPRIDEIADGITGYIPIRGREQQLYDAYRLMGSTMKNAIRPVSPWNPAGRLYHAASDVRFGNIAPYTGYIRNFSVMP
jgi:RHS repeat-associated protein